MISLDRLLGIPVQELPGVLLHAVGAAGYGITVADASRPDLPLVYVNAPFTSMTGYSADEVIGRNCRFLQGADTDPAAVETLRTGIKEGRDVKAVFLNYRKDGTAFFNELVLSVVRDGQGQVAFFIGVQVDVTARVQYEREQAWRATTDSLTGLGNRRRIVETMESWRSEDTEVAVVCLNIDHFRRVNDSHGYDVGSLLLTQVGRRLAQVARSGDAVARLEADTFALVRRTPRHMGQSEAADLAKLMTAAVLNPLPLPALRLALAVTCGSASWSGTGGSVESALTAARKKVGDARAEGATRPPRIEETFLEPSHRS